MKSAISIGHVLECAMICNKQDTYTFISLGIVFDTHIVKECYKSFNIIRGNTKMLMFS